MALVPLGKPTSFPLVLGTSVLAVLLSGSWMLLHLVLPLPEARFYFFLPEVDVLVTQVVMMIFERLLVDVLVLRPSHLGWWTSWY